MYQNTGGYSPITVTGLPHVRHPGELMTQLHEAETRLVCLTFAAGWCEPCRTLLALYSEIMTKCEDVVFLLADVDECGGLQAFFRVTMVPTIILIRRWEVIEMFVGCSAARLRRRLNLYRDADQASPPPRRTDLRRIYELIRDDTYMVMDQLREEQEEEEGEGETPGESPKPMQEENDPSAAAWKQPRGHIRGPEALGLSLAPKQTFPRDKNWRIADAYLTARRSKPSPVKDEPPSERDETKQQPSLLHSTSDITSKNPTGLTELLPQDINEAIEEIEGEKWAPEEEREEGEEGEEEEEEEWHEDMDAWRNSDWYRSIYDEWSLKRKLTKTSPSLGGVEEGKEPPDSKEKSEEPRHRRLSFVDDQDESARRPSRTESFSGRPRSILKAKKDISVIDEDDIMASSTWRKMQEENRRRRSTFTKRMLHTDLEDRYYSRAEVLDLMKRCQRACTARNLDSQYHELVTDVAGQELMKAKRQKDLQESQARADKRALLMAVAKAKATRMTVTPRLSLAPALGQPMESSESTTSVTQGSPAKEPRRSLASMPPHQSNVQSLRKSIAITAAHRSPASSRASMSSEAGATPAVATQHRDGIEPESLEIFGEGRDTLAEAFSSGESTDKTTQDPEKMLEAVESLRQARETVKDEDSSSVTSDTKMEERSTLRARLSKIPKVSFGSKDPSGTSVHSMHRFGDPTYVDVKTLKTKDEMHSYARRTSTDSRRTSIDSRRTSIDSRRTSTDARRISTDARRISTDGRRISTDARRISTDARRISTDGRRISTDGRRISTDPRDTSTEEEKQDKK